MCVFLKKNVNKKRNQLLWTVLLLARKVNFKLECWKFEFIDILLQFVQKVQHILVFSLKIHTLQWSCSCTVFACGIWCLCTIDNACAVLYHFVALCSNQLCWNLSKSKPQRMIYDKQCKIGSYQNVWLILINLMNFWQYDYF